MKWKKKWVLFLPLVFLVSLCIILDYLYEQSFGPVSFPSLMCQFGCVVCLIATILKARLIQWFTAGSFLVGYFFGVVFWSEGLDPGGGRTNNFWVIWATVYMIGIMVGIMVEIVIGIKKWYTHRISVKGN